MQKVDMMYIIGQKVPPGRVQAPSREWFLGSNITTAQVFGHFIDAFRF
jgi:hypothetical protein